jgi:hypothetical protein
MPPTVIASGSDAGEYEHASRLKLPAAITTEMLSATADATALFMTAENERPILMLATAGVLPS